MLVKSKSTSRDPGFSMQPGYPNVQDAETFKRVWKRSALIRGGDRTGVDSVEECRTPAQSAEHRAHVLEHEPQVRVLRIARVAGQCVVTQARDVIRTRLAADHLQHPGRVDLRPEQRGHVAGPDQVDDS